MARHEKVELFTAPNHIKTVEVKLTLEVQHWDGTEAHLVDAIVKDIRLGRDDMTTYLLSEYDKETIPVHIAKAAVWMDDANGVTPPKLKDVSPSVTTRGKPKMGRSRGYRHMSDDVKRTISREYFKMLNNGTSKKDARAILSKRYDRNDEYVARVARRYA